MAGVIDTNYTFNPTDTITSAKMNNILDESVFTNNALADSTLTTSSGKLKVNIITSTQLATSSVTANAIADGAVNQAKTNNSLIPSGAIMAFAMNGAPTGWLAANGTAVSRTTYSNLFSTIGTTYGAGDGSTTFNLPNLSGIFVRGSGSQTIEGVSYSRSFSTTQNDALQNITGRVATFANGASLGGNWHVEPQNATGSFYTTSSSGSMTTGGGGAGAGYLHVDFDASRVARASTETRPANIAFLYCIKI
jgi:microcystin-dependent protein